MEPVFKRIGEMTMLDKSLVDIDYHIVTGRVCFQSKNFSYSNVAYSTYNEARNAVRKAYTHTDYKIRLEPKEILEH